jgi:hypothetical protein
VRRRRRARRAKPRCATFKVATVSVAMFRQKGGRSYGSHFPFFMGERRKGTGICLYSSIFSMLRCMMGGGWIPALVAHKSHVQKFSIFSLMLCLLY